MTAELFRTRRSWPPTWTVLSSRRDLSWARLSTPERAGGARGRPGCPRSSAPGACTSSVRRVAARLGVAAGPDRCATRERIVADLAPVESGGGIVRDGRSRRRRGRASTCASHGPPAQRLHRRPSSTWSRWSPPGRAGTPSTWRSGSCTVPDLEAEVARRARRPSSWCSVDLGGGCGAHPAAEPAGGAGADGSTWSRSQPDVHRVRRLPP